MSDNDFDENDDAGNGESSVIRQLRADAKDKADAVRRAQELERKLAFAEAGIPLDERVKKYFIPQYDGEMTAEAIRAAAEADGFLAKAEAPAPAANAAEVQALQNIGQASTGAQVPDALAPDDAQDAALREAIRSGSVKTPQDIGNWLQQRGQPVTWDGPQTWEDGSQFRPLAG